MARSPKPRDRISQIRIQGFRSLEDVTLSLSGLSVLIGDNGAGKSAIVEAIETLRYFTEPSATVSEYFEKHPWPVRGGRGKFALAVDIASDDEVRAPRLSYAFAITHNDRGKIGVASEVLQVGPLPGKAEPLFAIRRDFADATLFDQGQRKLVKVQPSPLHLLMTQLVNDPIREGDAAVEQKAVRRLAAALSSIEVHLAFETMAAWVARRTGRKSACRESSMVLPARRLELLGANLGNVYHALKNEHGAAHWNETMDLVRLGLGRDIDDVSLLPDAAGGQHAISVRYGSLGTSVPANGLSDGTLAYLAFVALARLPSDRSLLTFDEPELHLHPGLLVRVLSMFESMAQSCPVVLTTHSDRLLDALQDPARSVVLCDVDERRATRLVRPDAEMLAKWLKDYRGFGEIRSTGLQDAVMPPRQP